MLSVWGIAEGLVEKYEIYEEHFDQIKSDQHFQLKVDDQQIAKYDLER